MNNPEVDDQLQFGHASEITDEVDDEIEIDEINLDDMDDLAGGDLDVEPADERGE